MNLSLISLELAVIALALGLLLLDLWTPPQHKAKLGYLAILGLLVILGMSFSECLTTSAVTGFSGMFVKDSLALFFKRFFIVTAVLVAGMIIHFADRIRSGMGELFTLTLLALSGMMFAASANDLIMVFVALELITVSFYILVSFQRSRGGSLEAGVKYLILGALSSSFLMFGVALVYGTAQTTSFVELAKNAGGLVDNKVFLLGALLILAGLGFKMAVVPFQIWAPDVYQGAPTPVTAFLAVGSKAAGVVLILRVFFCALPAVAAHWTTLLIVLAAITILYGNLCAIPQRNLKRLLGYSSISNAGYLLLGFAALSASGASAVLYYLLGYLFTLAAAFTVITVVCRDTEDLSSVAGLGQRSPFLAFVLSISMISLAGIPPMAGFFGKFLLLAAIIEKGFVNPGYYCLAGVTIFGVVISLYYYFNVIRAMYWSKEAVDRNPVQVPALARVSLTVCVAGILFLGLYPQPALLAAKEAVKVLSF
jgi:NADH-quinone oxidoreductase subunit N